MRQHVIRALVLDVAQHEPWGVVCNVGSDNLLGGLLLHERQVVGCRCQACVTVHPVDEPLVAHALDAVVATCQLGHLEHLIGVFLVEISPCHTALSCVADEGFIHTLQSLVGFAGADEAVVAVGNLNLVAGDIVQSLAQSLFGFGQFCIGGRRLVGQSLCFIPLLLEGSHLFLRIVAWIGTCLIGARANTVQQVDECRSGIVDLSSRIHLELTEAPVGLAGIAGIEAQIPVRHAHAHHWGHVRPAILYLLIGKIGMHSHLYP